MQVQVLPRASLDHVAALDGVRGLAILLVLVWHYLVHPFAGEPGSLAWQLARAGVLAWSGVDLFFVLSGFLLGSILIRYRGGSGYYTAFYLRRFCRIVPLYLVLLAVYFGLRPWLAGSPNAGMRWLFDNAMPWWSYATFTQNFVMAQAGTVGAHFMSVTWSLAVEEQFYLLLPLLIALTPPKALPWAAAALVAAAVLLRATLIPGQVQAFVLLPTRMDSLLCGVLLAALLEDPAARAWFAERRRFVSLLLGVLLLGCVALTVLPRMLGAYTFTLLAVFYSLLIAVVVTQQGGILARLLGVRWLAGLGAISYCVYLFHQAANGLLHALVFQRPPQMDGLASAGTSAVALAATIGFAVLTLHFLERPAVRAGRRLGYAGRADWSRRPSAASSSPCGRS